MAEKKANNDEKEDLGELIKKAHKTGGFFYLTSRDSQGEPYDGTVYYDDAVKKMTSHYAKQLVAARGFRKDFDIDRRSEESVPRYFGDASTHHETVARFIKECEKIDRPVNEVVFCKKADLTAIPHATLSDLLLGGSNEEAAYQMSYSVVRQEKDGQEKGKIITQTFVGPHQFIGELVSLLKKDPNQAHKLFEGVFPKLDQKYHGVRNGRILITGLGATLPLDNPDYAERFAQDYEANGKSLTAL